ncbi:MAG TPA: hypothetical protein VGJ94_02550 [Syntrophorhabdaceae bacterium]|jgi:hypothetical protein
MIPSSRARVPVHTAEQVNERIRRNTEYTIKLYSTAGREAIDRRLKELDEEWDVERMIEANASAISIVGLTLGATVSRKWFVLPAIVAGFLFQHALQGWCPPIPVLRRLGFRTSQEIDYERYALKAIRGDFTAIDQSTSADRALSIMEQ